MNRYNEKQFIGLHRADFKSPHLAFLSSKLACKPDGFDYIPGAGLFIASPSNLSLNSWRGGGVNPAAGSCDTIIEHFDYIFQDEDVKKHWLNCFASIAQNPSAKIKHCLLLIGEQGTGKSFFKVLLMRMLGEANVATLESRDLQASFNSHILNAQVAVVEELMASGRLEAYNTIKPYVSEDKITARQKHVSEYLARTPYAMLAFSNHPKPILLGPKDRRFHVFKSPVQARPEDYYDKLFDSLSDELPGFLHMLLQRDLSAFNPNGRPPMTDDKKLMIEVSEPPLQMQLRELIEEGAVPFHRDLVTRNEVIDALSLDNGYSGKRPSRVAVHDALLALESVSLGQQRIKNSDLKPTLWAIRNAHKWVRQDNCARSEEYTRKPPGRL